MAPDAGRGGQASNPVIGRPVARFDARVQLTGSGFSASPLALVVVLGAGRSFGQALRLLLFLGVPAADGRNEVHDARWQRSSVRQTTNHHGSDELHRSVESFGSSFGRSSTNLHRKAG